MSFARSGESPVTLGRVACGTGGWSAEGAAEPIDGTSRCQVTRIDNADGIGDFGRIGTCDRVDGRERCLLRRWLRRRWSFVGGNMNLLPILCHEGRLDNDIGCHEQKNAQVQQQGTEEKAGTIQPFLPPAPFIGRLHRYKYPYSQSRLMPPLFGGDGGWSLRRHIGDRVRLGRERVGWRFGRGRVEQRGLGGL